MADNLCKMCGRRLTDPDSIKRKIGAGCWKKLHVGEVKRRRGQKIKRKKQRFTWQQIEFGFEGEIDESEGLGDTEGSD